jgi:hypothetical protein
VRHAAHREESHAHDDDRRPRPRHREGAPRVSTVADLGLVTSAPPRGWPGLVALGLAGSLWAPAGADLAGSLRECPRRVRVETTAPAIDVTAPSDRPRPGRIAPAAR